MPKPNPPDRGAGLFSDPGADTRPGAPSVWRANIDGGSRGNPGPAAYGVVIRDPRGDIVARLKKYIGRTTNNVAEYYGLIAALDYAQSNNIRALHMESDSELLVKQMRGQYKVKSADLQPLFERARKMSQSLVSFRITHVFRAQNREADALANEALDEVSRTSPAANAGKKEPQFSSGKQKTGQHLESQQSFQRPVRARFRGGVLYLLEDLDLPDGAEVDIFLRPPDRN